MADVGNANASEPIAVASAGANTETDVDADVETDPMKKWRCDVCKVRFFEDFHEACAHEEECQMILDAKEAAAPSTDLTNSVASTLVTQDTLELEPTKEAKLSNSASSSHQNATNVDTTLPVSTKEKASKPKKIKTTTTKAQLKPPSPIITPTKPSAKSSLSDKKSLSQTRIGQQKQPKQTKQQPKTIVASKASCNSAVIPLVQAIKDAMFSQIKPMKESTLTEGDVGQLKDMLQRLESLDVTFEVLQKTLIGTVVSKFKKHPFLGETAKALVQKWKAIAKKKETEKAKANAKAIEAKKQAQKEKQHSFFNPRSASAASSKPKNAKQSVPINPFFAPRKKTPADAVIEETKSLKRKLPCPEDVKLSPETTKVVAAIFQNKSHKQIIAEQRKAELAANREAERKREKERAAKRAEFFASKKETTTTTIRPTKSLLPIALRFPTPNHVGLENYDTFVQEAACGDVILPENHPFRSTAKALDNDTTPTVTDIKSYLSSPSALDTIDAKTTTFTSIQRALFETFSILPQKNDDNSHPNNQRNLQLWSDSFGRMDKDGIVGDQPRRVFCELAECIDHWRVARNESLEKMAERHRKLARGKKPKKKPKKRPKRSYEYYEDDDWLVGDDVEDPEDLAPLCLLVGPHASGKTAMVHSVAKHCGNCKVLEINTSRARSGASLKHAIEEATQSNSSLEMLQNKTNNNSNSNSDTKNFFAQTKKPKTTTYIVDSDSEDETEDKKKSSVTIVLIDEVDILFDDADAGFWSALWALARATKCPIVLTANQCPPQLKANASKLPCKTFALERPSAEDCAAKLWGICRQQSSVLKICPQLAAQGPEAIQKQLSAIATSCDCDLRKLLHELQVFAALAAARLAPPRAGWPASMKAKSTSSTIRTEASASNNSLKVNVPTITSLEPSQIPLNQHSVVMVKGSNLDLLSDQTRILLGSRTIAKWHVVNDTTLLLQCPPFLASKEDPEWVANPSGRWIKRVVPLSIEIGTNPKVLKSSSRILVSDSLADGSRLHGTFRPTIEYVLPEEPMTVARDGKNDDDEEAEFGIESAQSNQQIEIEETLPPASSTVNEDDLVTWKKAIANAPTTSTTSAISTTKTTQQDIATASELDFLAKRYRDASDACLLEDFGDGLPYLSGACRGFAYDYTEDGCASYPPGGADTLKMHEKSKPPREEKLFALGWKDDCCFYGNSETYMTLPSISQRREAKTIMNNFRGDEAASGQLACASTTATGTSSSAAVAALSSDDLQSDSVVFREDLDQFVHHQQTSCDSAAMAEDCYLPRGVPQLILDLPDMLRTQSICSGSNDDAIEEENVVWDALEAHRSETLCRIVDHTTNYILPPPSSSAQHKSDRSKWSYGRFSLDTNHGDRHRLILECLPALRRIGAVERCAEFIHEQQLEAAANGENQEVESSSLRRSTRRVTRAAPKQRFHHYFDKLSSTLRRDEADLQTSEVGALFADQWQSDLVRPFGSQLVERKL